MRHAHLKLDLFFEFLYLLVDLTEVLSIFIEFHIEVKLSPCSIVPSSFQYINKLSANIINIYNNDSQILIKQKHFSRGAL